ncbi:hypothetical protein AB9F46_35610, partial [Rhizobium leguminosarum]
LSILVYQEAFSFQRAGSGASLALIVTLLLAGPPRVITQMMSNTLKASIVRSTRATINGPAR